MKFESTLERTEKSIKDEFQRNRTESNEISRITREELTKSLNSFSEGFSKNVKELNELLNKKFSDLLNQQTEFNKQVTENNKSNREELSNSLKSFEAKFTENTKEINEIIRQKFGDFSKIQADINKQTTDSVKEVRETIEKQLKSIREDNTRQLDEMRKTVDEKLQKTLNERLSQSFETVGKQLQAVQEGLGEMKNLASDVGGLKKVLSNVKMRGGIGEIQLSMLLEQILAPEQYEANVRTKLSSADVVEFAIRLPGRDDAGTTVWLPIDAKFPKEVYEHLQEAYDEGEQGKILIAQKTMETAIKKMAKDISEKYLDPPNTTDFGIMFLPFEGIYAEVVRKAALLEDLQRNYKIIVTGPTTLAAILNSLQMGFKTLAIQKRSSEVWQVLGAVKKEFSNFGDMMGKAKKHIETGLNQLDDVMGKRTRAIQRKLKSVEELSEGETKKILPEVNDTNLLFENEDEGIE
ncbi:MAG: DNA recombination protein RmuC [Bacteroidales bacterium]|nr:DNA recombination protein RmuC [Bacteroidales bacterium]